MVRQGHSSQLVLLVLGMTLGTGGCVTPADLSLRNDAEEARRAMQLAQEREQVLTALRADMASTRVAAAKQEAELQELRSAVTHLRQENSASQQALLEAKQTIEARQSELATLKTEREQLAQASPAADVNGPGLASLQHEVASLSQELAELKQAMALATSHDTTAREMKSSSTAAPYMSVRSRPRQNGTGGIIPAVQVLTADDHGERRTWITVQPGESLWSLARKHQTTIEALRRANGKDSDLLTVGEALQLP